MSCDLTKLLERTRPPDPDIVDLIERAFLEQQIDSQRSDLAYLILAQMSAFSAWNIN